MPEFYRAWMILGTTVGATAWLFTTAWQAHDGTAAVGRCVPVGLLVFVAIVINRGKSRLQTMRYMLVHLAAVGVITAVTVNLRLYD